MDDRTVTKLSSGMATYLTKSECKELKAACKYTNVPFNGMAARPDAALHLIAMHKAIMAMQERHEEMGESLDAISENQLIATMRGMDAEAIIDTFITEPNAIDSMADRNELMRGM